MIKKILLSVFYILAMAVGFLSAWWIIIMGGFGCFVLWRQGAMVMAFFYGTLLSIVITRWFLLADLIIRAVYGVWRE